MDKLAVIEGKEVELTEEECEGAADFHCNRLAFCWVGGDLKFNTDKTDDRDHRHWIMEDYGIAGDEFEQLPRGYARPDQITVYAGTDFKCIRGEELTSVTKDLEKLIAEYKRFFGEQGKRIPIYNGVKNGKVGEIWEPLETICNVEV